MHEVIARVAREAASIYRGREMDESPGGVDEGKVRCGRAREDGVALKGGKDTC